MKQNDAQLFLNDYIRNRYYNNHIRNKQERKKGIENMRKFEMKNQKAMEYAMYMIAGSYFAKVWNRKSKLQETKLKLYYQEEALNTQYLMEEICIDYIENYLMEILPEHIWKEEVELLLKVQEDTCRTSIRFEGRDFSLELQIHAGRIVNVRHEFGMCQEEACREEVLYFQKRYNAAA